MDRILRLGSGGLPGVGQVSVGEMRTRNVHVFSLIFIEVCWTGRFAYLQHKTSYKLKF